MNIEVDMGDIGVSLDTLAFKVGESTEQATIRYGVAAARSLAEATNPKRSTAASRKKSAAVFMRRTVMAINGNTIRKLLRSGGGRLRMTKSSGRGAEWVHVGIDKIITNENALWKWVENNRSQGKTRNLPAREKRVCSKAVFAAVLKKRQRLWGAAKGAWIGGGQDVAMSQKGLNRINIGKNFLSWAQRHTSKGSGKKVGFSHNTEVHLTNRTTGAAKQEGITNSGIVAALNKARRAVFAYYAGELRRMRIQGRR